jgi:hypothetical protein
MIYVQPGNYVFFGIVTFLKAALPLLLISQERELKNIVDIYDIPRQLIPLSLTTKPTNHFLVLINTLCKMPTL